MDKWVQLDVPPRFQMGPQRIAANCGWRVRQDGNRLLVCLDERYLGRPARLFESVRVDAVDLMRGASSSAFREWPRQDEHHGEWRSKAVEQYERYLRSEIQEEWLYGWQLMILVASDSEFLGLVGDAFSTLVGSLPGASLWAVNVSPQFRWRSALVRVLFGALETPELMERSPDEFEGFPAGREFSISDFSLDSLINPALVTTSPWVFGLSSARLGGVITILFGELLYGVRAGSPVPELLDLYAPRTSSSDSPPTTERRPDFASEDLERFFRWWVARLNDLFGVLLDPARFASDGVHDAKAQFAGLLSVERLFTTLQAMMASWHDDFSRRLMLFDILDILEGIDFGSTETLLTMKRANEALSRIRDTGAGVTAPAIRKCEAAVKALDEVRGGFFLRERATDDGLRITDKHGNDVVLSWDSAVSGYLRLLRNSTHSFKKKVRDPRARSLLAAHTGHVPAALADLGLLHVMDLLLRPERLGTAH